MASIIIQINGEGNIHTSYEIRENHSFNCENTQCEGCKNTICFELPNGKILHWGLEDLVDHLSAYNPRREVQE